MRHPQLSRTALRWRALAPLSLTLLMTSSLPAALRLPRHFADHMVLQQAAEVPVWGWAEAGATVGVTASWDDGAHTTAADADGRWEVRLPTPPAERGGEAPRHTLTIASGTETLRLSDVLIGEVWFLSGQSNMEMQLGGWPDADPPSPILGSAPAIAGAEDDALRLLIVGRQSASTPQETTADHWAVAEWSVSAPATAREFSAVGYFFGRELRAHLGVPVGLIQSAWGGSSAEAWIPREALEATGELSEKAPWASTGAEDNQSPTVLYNGMISPLGPLAVRGVLWYQGETNVGRAEQYATLMPTLIGAWRERWGQPTMPFFFAHLAPWGGYGPVSLQELWDAQTRTLAVPGTGLAATIDLGDPANIHPANKQPIGHRFALLARARVYGETGLVDEGPRPLRASREGAEVVVEFSSTGAGLVVPEGQFAGFELAGADGEFHPAVARCEGDRLHLRAEGVDAPHAVRYAWTPAPVPTLYNREGLPAAPFRIALDPVTGAGAPR